MKLTSVYLKQLLLSGLCLFAMLSTALAQKPLSEREVKEFNLKLSRAGIVFSMPEGFVSIRPISTDETSFDYGITIPGSDFEIWFNVRPYKDSEIAGYRTATIPDSVYIEWGRARAAAFSADNNYYARNLSPTVLEQYNADWGKSYFLALNDSPSTRHYKYALLITLQKNHTGTIMAVCLTNTRGPEFFKNINRARNCIKFKQ